MALVETLLAEVIYFFETTAELAHGLVRLNLKKLGIYDISVGDSVIDSTRVINPSPSSTERENVIQRQVGQCTIRVTCFVIHINMSALRHHKGDTAGSDRKLFC